MSINSFDSRTTLTVGDQSFDIFSIDSVEGSARLPYSLKVLLENVLRTEDGANVTADHVRAIAGWDPNAGPDTEIQFSPARVIMQDFTGVPCVVDLATMREAVRDLGGDAARARRGVRHGPLRHRALRLLSLRRGSPRARPAPGHGLDVARRFGEDAALP